METEREITVRCNDCDKRLMKFLVRCDTKKPYKIQATCPFCRGSSDIIDIDGIGYSRPILEQDDNSNTPTFIEDVIDCTNRFVFKIKKKEI